MSVEKKDAILELYHTDFPLGELYFEPWQNMDIDTRVDENLQYHCPQTQLFQIKVEYDQDLLLGIIHDNVNLNEQEKDIYYTSANHLGSAAWITRNDGIPVQYMHYLPYGQLLANQTPAGYNERFKFIGKERDVESGYDNFGARYYIAPFLHFASVEPLLDKYLHISPYSYAAWNPIKYVDRDGEYVEVSPNDDGTYQITNGYMNNDRNIYVVKNGKRTNEILGQTYSKYSFFNANGDIIKSTINPDDQSGNDFLSDFQSNPPSLHDYVKTIEDYENNQSGRNFGRYDFKSRGMSLDEYKNMGQEEIDKYYYRGMPISVGGKTVYGTARDVGNFAAGYLAGRKGLGILPTLIGFDIYQKGIEPPVSRTPQLWGYYRGIKDLYINLLY